MVNEFNSPQNLLETLEMFVECAHKVWAFQLWHNEMFCLLKEALSADMWQIDSNI